MGFEWAATGGNESKRVLMARSRWKKDAASSEAAAPSFLMSR